MGVQFIICPHILCVSPVQANQVYIMDRPVFFNFSTSQEITRCRNHACVYLNVKVVSLGLFSKLGTLAICVSHVLDTNGR